MARGGNKVRNLDQQSTKVDGEHPWKEQRDLDPSDVLLRKHLFRIVARPGSGPAVWERNGIRCTQEQAERLTLAEGGD